LTDCFASLAVRKYAYLYRHVKTMHIWISYIFIIFFSYKVIKYIYIIYYIIYDLYSHLYIYISPLRPSNSWWWKHAILWYTRKTVICDIPLRPATLYLMITIRAYTCKTCIYFKPSGKHNIILHTVIYSCCRTSLVRMPHGPVNA